MKQQVIDILDEIVNILVQDCPICNSKIGKKGCAEHSHMFYYFDKIRDKLQALGDGWIAVTERLPDERKEVILCLFNGNRFSGFFDENKYYTSGCTEIDSGTVTHWQPLPLPPNK